MDPSKSMQTPSPNKEFLRVSSRNLTKERTQSPNSSRPVPKNIEYSSPVVAKPALVAGNGAGRFSPAQYLGRSLSQPATPTHAPATNTASNGNSPGSLTRSLSAQRLQKPLLLSQTEMKEARRDRTSTQLQNCATENSMDYIGLTPSYANNKTQIPTAPSVVTPAAVSSPGEDGAEMPPDSEDESPPPPPPPMFPVGMSPLSRSVSLDQLRRLKDSEDGLAPSLHAIASPVSTTEDEGRLRRFRRIQAMQQEYRGSVQSALNECNNGDLNPAAVFFPTTRAGSEAISHAREQVVGIMHQWSALHGNAVEELDGRVGQLAAQRAEHLALQQKLVTSEALLAREGETNTELLQTLRAAVLAAEDRVGGAPGALYSILREYPAAWFQTSEADGGSLPASSARSRSNSETSSIGTFRSSGRLSLQGRGDTTHARATTPTSAADNAFLRYSIGTSLLGSDHDALDPTLMPSSERFQSPWKFRMDPQVAVRLAEVSTAGHRFYGPPAQERRYDRSTSPGSVSIGTRSRSGSFSGSRSGSATRSRLGTFSSTASHTAAAEQQSDLSTDGGYSRSTSASLARLSQPRRSPVSKEPARSPVKAPAKAPSSSERYLRSISSGRAATAPIARNRSSSGANVFTASGEVYSADAPQEHEPNEADYPNHPEEQTSDNQDRAQREQQPREDKRVEGNSEGEESDYSRPEYVSESENEDRYAAQQTTMPEPARAQEPRGAKLSRHPSNSAASGRLTPDARLGGEPTTTAAGMQPVDISQLRSGEMPRNSSVATSSDAGYAGSRYSDLQWDEVAQVMRVGHRAPLLAPTEPMVTTSSSHAGNRVYGDGNTSLIRGNNAKEEGNFWDISSSSDSNDFPENAQPTHWVAAGQASASFNPTASLRNDGTGVASPQTRNTYSAGITATRTPAAIASPTRTESLGNFASPLMRHRARPPGAPIQSPNTGSYMVGNGGAQLPATAGRMTSGAAGTPTSATRKVLARPSSTPKVKVPIQSRAALTEEAQLAALATKIAARNEVDDYIASLKRTIK